MPPGCCNRGYQGVCVSAGKSRSYGAARIADERGRETSVTDRSQRPSSVQVGAFFALFPAPRRRTMSYMNTLTVRIPDELQKQLDRLCKRQHRPTSEIVRESLRRYLAAEQLRRVREGLRPYAEAKGFLTDEDVFKAVS